MLFMRIKSMKLFKNRKTIYHPINNLTLMTFHFLFCCSVLFLLFSFALSICLFHYLCFALVHNLFKLLNSCRRLATQGGCIQYIFGRVFCLVLYIFCSEAFLYRNFLSLRYIYGVTQYSLPCCLNIQFCQRNLFVRFSYVLCAQNQIFKQQHRPCCII